MKAIVIAKTTRDSAFSLIEVMVASAVLAIVMAILLGTLSTSMALWRNTESKQSADREGRAAELLLAQDVASAVMSTNPNLWPRVANGRLQFLTTKPADYQRMTDGDFGDVCLVEYAVDSDNHSLVRSFFGSKKTYELLKAAGSGGSLPTPPTGGAEPQLLATNVLKDMHDAVRGLGVYKEPLRTNFVMLGQDLMPASAPYSAGNPPAAVEVNLGVADPDSIANEDLLQNENYKLRNAGFYSFRLSFPRVTP